MHNENSKEKLKQKSKQITRRPSFESSSSDDFEDILSTSSSEDSEYKDDSSDKDPATMDRKLFEEQQRLLTALAQKLAAKDIRIDKFRGYETDDVNRWFEKLELQLEAKGIRTTDSAAISQVVNNLGGPAQTFMFKLPPHERKDYASLKEALKRRYSSKDRAWVRRQRLVSRKQGQHEPLADYIHEMHELFSGLDMGETEKVTYFTKGLQQSLKVKVLERMPETLFEAEEIARTVDSISHRVNQPSNDANLEKLLKSLVLQNAELTVSLNKLNSSTAPTVKASSPVNVSSLDGPPAVAVFNDSLRGNNGTDAPRNEIRKLGEMFQKLSREMDARFRGIVRRNQAPRVEQARERTRDGRPTCFTCGRTGHLQASCPERRNLGYRSQIQPQQGTARPSYSENPRYNQPREDYRSFPQLNRRDQGLAVLSESWYDGEFVAQFKRSRSKHAYSSPNSEHQLASTKQEKVEILSNDTVRFSRQRSHNTVNFHQNLTRPRSLMFPSNDGVVGAQSFPDQPEVTQLPLPGNSCSGPGSACHHIAPNNTQATEPTQPKAIVDVKSLLEPMLRAIHELKTNGTQTPTPEGSFTRPVSHVGEQIADAVPEQSFTSAQSFYDPSGYPLDTQPQATHVEQEFPVPSPEANSPTSATSNESCAAFHMDHSVHISTHSWVDPAVLNIGDDAVEETSEYSSPDFTPVDTFSESPREPSALNTLRPATAHSRQHQPNAPADDTLAGPTEDESAPPLAPVSAQQGVPCQNQSKEFRPKPRDLTVSARIFGQEIKLLVDTGAGLSVMNETLGHVISKDGIYPDPEKLSAIQEYPVPRTVKEVRAFLGLANYYRKFAKIAGPLHDLTKKGLKFYWSNDCQIAFDRLKEALTQSPILAYPDFAKEFTLATDASDEGLGYVLGQVQDGREVVIGYAGRKLLPAEKNYSVTEREALALVAGIRHFRSYLYGVHFKVFTDHSAVRWLMQLKEPSGRLARWALLLQQYDFDIIHRAGHGNGNADALSRRPYGPVIATFDSSGVQIERVRDLQRRDPALADIIEYLEWEELPANNKKAKALLHTIDQYYLDPDGLLCHIWFPGNHRVPTPKSQLVIPAALRHEVLLQVHDIPFSGHLGVNKTYAKLRDRYYWPKMYMDVEHYVLSCESCAMRKTPKQRTATPLLPLPVTGPGERWAVDCLGPFVESTNKYRYVVVFTDYCTRLVECFAVPNIEARTIADLLVKEIMSRHGAPRVLFSDRGSNFLSSLVKEVCFLMNTNKTFTTITGHIRMVW